MIEQAIISIVDPKSFNDGYLMMHKLSKITDTSLFLCGDMRKISGAELQVVKDDPKVELFDTSHDNFINESIDTIKPMLKYRQIQNQDILVPFLLDKIEAKVITVLSPYTLVLDAFRIPVANFDIVSALASEYHGVRDDNPPNAYMKQVSKLEGIKINLAYFTYNKENNFNNNIASEFIKVVKQLNEDYNLRLSVEEGLAFSFNNLGFKLDYLSDDVYPDMGSILTSIPNLILNNTGISLCREINQQSFVGKYKLAKFINLELINLYYEQVKLFNHEQLNELVVLNEQQIREIIILRNQQLQDDLRRENEKSIISN